MFHVNTVIARDPAEVGKLAAVLFETVLRVKPACVIGLATGSTPLPLYRELIEREKAGRIDSANLNEYKGLAPDHSQRATVGLCRKTSLTTSPSNPRTPSSLTVWP